MQSPLSAATGRSSSPASSRPGLRLGSSTCRLSCHEASTTCSCACPGAGSAGFTGGAADDGSPVFTPDGKRILFIRGPGRARRTPLPHVYSIRPDGTEMHRLAGAQCGMAPPRYGGLDVSPDGRRIAFSVVAADPIATCDAPLPGTWSEPLAGGAPKPVWPNAFVGYSPSGRSVAFSDEGIRMKRLGDHGRAGCWSPATARSRPAP